MAKGTMIIDGLRVPFDGEKNVLSVIRKAGIDMPTFCYYSELSVYGACRMCIVEDVKTGKIDASCSMEPRDGLEIRTNTSRLLRHRRLILELLLASHDCSCTTCGKSGNCRLQELAQRFGVRHIRFPDTRPRFATDNTSHAIFRDPNKCILCGDCVRVCEELQGQGILNFAYRGSDLQVMPAFDKKLSETKCVGCGQCAAVCTTGAITVNDQIGDAWRALHDAKKRVVVQIAPAVRVAIGENFGLPAGTNVLDKLVTALKLMGADEVYDTNFGADMTTISEAEEFLGRLKNGGPFPMFTSCCPAWVKYLELNNPHHLKNISSCKSPMEMLAAVIRDRYAEKDAADGRTTYQIAIMPCTAKKMEAARDEFIHDGRPDVDLVLTTRELVDMIREAGIRFSELEPESPDLPFGLGSGAAVIYGVTGGGRGALLPARQEQECPARRVRHQPARHRRHPRGRPPPRGAGAAHRDCQRTCQRARAAPPHRRGRGGLSPHRGHVLPGRLRRRRGSALRPDGRQAQARRGPVRVGLHGAVQARGEEPDRDEPSRGVRRGALPRAAARLVPVTLLLFFL